MIPESNHHITSTLSAYFRPSLFSPLPCFSKVLECLCHGYTMLHRLYLSLFSASALFLVPLKGIYSFLHLFSMSQTNIPAVFSEVHSQKAITNPFICLNPIVRLCSVFSIIPSSIHLFLKK